jgi:hypothetical protein
MKLYRISFRGVGVVEGEHGGYAYASSKREVARITAKAKSSDYPVEDVEDLPIVENNGKFALDFTNEMQWETREQAEAHALMSFYTRGVAVCD